MFVYCSVLQFLLMLLLSSTKEHSGGLAAGSKKKKILPSDLLSFNRSGFAFKTSNLIWYPQTEIQCEAPSCTLVIWKLNFALMDYISRFAEPFRNETRQMRWFGKCPLCSQSGFCFTSLNSHVFIIIVSCKGPQLNRRDHARLGWGQEVSHAVRTLMCKTQLKSPNVLLLRNPRGEPPLLVILVMWPIALQKNFLLSH